MFVLARFGDLRIPSQIRLLRWCDLDWENNRFTIHSPETEHLEGKASRVVPSLPELRPCFDAAFELTPEGSEFVFERYREHSNLATPLRKIVKREGLTMWPKSFHALRSTRKTEQEDEFPSHVVCACLANSERTSARHYLQVTDAHFNRATAAHALHGVTKTA